MSKLSLSQTNKLLTGKLIGKDAEFTSVSTDSRTIKPGQLFVAIVGPNFDGHQFIEEVKNKGAAAALVSKAVTTDLSLLQVEDTLKALGKLATLYRQQFDLPIIALTGSCGKTTTKEMIRAILSECGPTLANEGNLNNDIGLPVTLSKLQAEHRYAVIEMGANHPGEIAYLTQITRPKVAFINNIAPAHLEGFGSVEGVANAKAEIFFGLQEDGVALINADDQYANWLKEKLNGKKVMTFGIERAADYQGHSLKVDAEGRYSFMLKTPQGEIAIQLPVLGKHNVLNAIAAAAATNNVGASLTAIKTGLEKMQAVNGRLVVKQGYAGARIFDDTYNANPFSVQAALQVLANYKGERVFVFGDMGELGERAEQYHSEIGRLAKELGIDHLYAWGKLSQATVKAFGKGGYHFADKAKLSEAVKGVLKADMTVLVKGSRSARMEQVVAALL
jgi:UDP-N-acetylmuramoyl-tripeptide--D-alanyl-D-alanine ligase